jgi:hypothetical protein
MGACPQERQPILRRIWKSHWEIAKFPRPVRSSGVSVPDPGEMRLSEGSAVRCGGPRFSTAGSDARERPKFEPCTAHHSDPELDRFCFLSEWVEFILSGG